MLSNNGCSYIVVKASQLIRYYEGNATNKQLVQQQNTKEHVFNEIGPW